MRKIARLGCLLLTVILFSADISQGQQLTPAEVKALPECALGRTDTSCKLVIDRENPVAPPSVQMYSDQRLTVVVKHPKEFERYFLDNQTGQATLVPDVTSSIAQGLLPSLGKIGEFTALLYAARAQPPPPDSCNDKKLTDPVMAGHVQDVVPAFQQCLGELAAKAIGIYKALDPLLAPDSLTPPGAAASPTNLDDVLDNISDFLQAGFKVSSRISTVATDLKASAPDAPALLQLTNLQKLADNVANDLMGYARRIADLDDFDNGEKDCKDLIPVTAQEANDGIQCVYITSRKDDQHVYHNMVTRTITYAVNTLNLISNSQEAAVDSSKKRLLATVAINFADTPTPFPGNPGSAFRWEASAGAFFSTLPIRSFSAAPVFTNGAVSDKRIVQNVLHPTVVPFAAANYRLSNDLKWSRWKSAIYWTAAVGINPNTVSADFGTGISLSWRALMLSGLSHFGHDVRLTQGLKVGESLGASFNGSLATQTYWTTTFAFGVSIRVPSLTGR